MQSQNGHDVSETHIQSFVRLVCVCVFVCKIARENQMFFDDVVLDKNIWTGGQNIYIYERNSNSKSNQSIKWIKFILNFQINKNKLKN